MKNLIQICYRVIFLLLSLAIICHCIPIAELKPSMFVHLMQIFATYGISHSKNKGSVVGLFWFFPSLV